MRATLLVTMIILSGCASLPAPNRLRNESIDSHCLVDHASQPSYHGRLETSLYLEGQRVPDDDLVAATARDARANQLAERAVRAQRLGIGGMLLGGLLLAPGAGMVGFGEDQRQTTALAVGAALTAVGAGMLVASVIVLRHSGEERQRAIAQYNDDLPPTCR